MKYVLLFIVVTITSINAQVLHHQMISSQGNVSRLLNGMVVTQTIGQIGVTGVFGNSNSFKGIQGYQQALFSDSKSIDQNSLNQLYVYPNPFTSFFSIHLSDVKLGDIIEGIVYDLNGRILYNNKLIYSGNDFNIYLENLPKATYYLTLQYRGKKDTIKIIKQ